MKIAIRFSPAFRSQGIRKKFTSENEILLLYVGRLAPEKELDVLMGAAQILNSKDLEYKLVIVGDGPLRKPLQDKRVNNVVFLGYKSGKELSKLYASADIFVFPSSTETYGNVILEAMASGLPVIAPYTGGIRENLVHMYNGVSFNPGNAKDMAKAIEILISDGYIKGRLAQNAVQHASLKSWDMVFEKLFEKYKQVIDIYRRERSSNLSA